MSQVTVITGLERRRRWPVEERLRIVETACAPGVVVADVARQFDICTSLIYKWRREARAETAPGFMPVTLKEGVEGFAPRGPEPALVVEFAGGVRVALSAHAPAGLVNAVLKALRR